MDERALKEAWEDKMGSDCPAGFINLSREYLRRKGVYNPAELDGSDFASLTMIYEILIRPQKKGKDND